MSERGIVTALDGGAAVVALEGNGHCNDCGARIVCRPNPAGQRMVRARNPHAARTGQQVGVTQTHDLLLKLSVMQYGLPLLGFLGGIFAAYGCGAAFHFMADEVTWFMAGLAGLALSALAARLWAGKTARQNPLLFVISDIYQGI